MQTSMPPGSNIPGTELPLAPDTGVQLPGASPTVTQAPTLPGMQAGAVTAECCHEQTAAWAIAVLQSRVGALEARLGPPPAPVTYSRDLEVRGVKQLRRDIDAQLQSLKHYCTTNPSREKSLSVTKLQEAIMWLGMDLKRLNEANPYPESKNPDSPVIEPTADGLKL